MIFLPFFLGLSLAAPYTYEGLDNQEAEDDDEYKGFSEAYEGKISLTNTLFRGFLHYISASHITCMKHISQVISSK